MAARHVVLALAGMLALTLPGCGWQPLYADPQSGPASAALRAIRVDPIPERIGQRLELALRDSFNPTGEPTPARYRLQTTLAVALSDLGIQTQGTAALARLDVTATYNLLDLRTGAVLLTNTVHVQNSFALNPNQYSTTVGQDDAGVRSVAELDQEIVTRLTLFMERRAAPAAPPVERS
ncbi:MAG TPA: LPS assembly lipoprotein LptE [Stellaceae bacterium]|nr:LPS assembly lipoprotein LptE [Stellaceae bacterium]